MDTIFTNGFVWDGVADERFRGEVRVSGNRIQTVARQPAALPQAGAEIVDMQGATLIPGLIEGHGHISFNNFSSYWEMVDMPPEENLLVTLENAKLYLDHGFTSVYSAGTVRIRHEAVIRNAIDAGRWPGPRLRACCPTITTTGALNDERQLHQTRAVTSLIADGPDEVRRVVRLAAREGNDNIKFNLCGDDDGIPRIAANASNLTTMTEAEVAAGMEAALRLRKSICVHSRTIESVRMALKYGAHVLYHVDLLDEETIDMMEAAKDRIIVGPGFGFYHEIVKLGPATGMDTGRMSEIVENGARITQELRKRGIRAVIGGDYGVVVAPHGTNARDIDHYVTYGGYSPVEALRCATKNGGDMMMMGHELGQIRAGYLADLLLVKGDPTSDVKLLQDKANLLAIMKDGKFHKPPEDLAARRQAA